MAEPAPGQHSIRQRVDELYRRLQNLPQASSAQVAYKQLCETLDEVEDEWSGITKKTPPPPPTAPDGRMYCPSDDNILYGSDGSILALTRGHRIEISPAGVVRVVNKATLRIEFEK